MSSSRLCTNCVTWVIPIPSVGLGFLLYKMTHWITISKPYLVAHPSLQVTLKYVGCYKMTQ